MSSTNPFLQAAESVQATPTEGTYIEPGKYLLELKSAGIINTRKNGPTMKFTYMVKEVLCGRDQANHLPGAVVVRLLPLNGGQNKDSAHLKIGECLTAVECLDPTQSFDRQDKSTWGPLGDEDFLEALAGKQVVVYAEQRPTRAGGVFTAVNYYPADKAMEYINSNPTETDDLPSDEVPF